MRTITESVNLCNFSLLAKLCHSTIPIKHQVTHEAAMLQPPAEKIVIQVKIKVGRLMMIER